MADRLIRGQRVILDADLAKLYDVPTKRLNQQVKRNSDRFPEDFLFQLTIEEKTEVVANCDHLSRLKFSPALPHAFTEHGAIYPVRGPAICTIPMYCEAIRIVDYIPGQQMI